MSGWMIGSTALAAALLCSLLMGLALQRGGTCTVAAVHELLTERRPDRLLALMEAAAWVGALVWLARQAGWLGRWPGGWALNAWTLLGALVLAWGAVLNGACALGTIARLGQGDWSYAATPLGYFLGVRAALSAGVQGLAQPLLGVAPPLAQAPAWALAGVGLLAWLRLRGPLRHLLGLPGRQGRPAAGSVHLATVALGLLFGVLMVLAGAWAYTDVLAELARMAQRPDAASLLTRLLLGGVLLAGAVAGGRLGTTWRPRSPRLPQLLRCLGGGALMGAGSLLVPGGNDGLVLIGLPLLWPSAWAAFITMVLTVGLTLLAGRAWAGRTP